MYYVYFIRNNAKQSTYIGYTSDLRRRIREHKAKRPDLVYYEAYKSQKDARVRERMLKQRGQAVRWLKNRISYSLQMV